MRPRTNTFMLRGMRLSSSVSLKSDSINSPASIARERGCPIQIGTDTLFEQIPRYLEFFGFGQITPDELRAVAMLS